MSARPRTPLQRATGDLAALVRSSRETLTDDEYRAFTTTALALLAKECDRITFGEVLRALRAEGER